MIRQEGGSWRNGKLVLWWSSFLGVTEGERLQGEGDGRLDVYSICPDLCVRAPITTSPLCHIQQRHYSFR